MRDKLDGKEEVKLEREEWMLELPSAKEVRKKLKIFTQKPLKKLKILFFDSGLQKSLEYLIKTLI